VTDPSPSSNPLPATDPTRVAGVGARRLAVYVFDAVTTRNRALDEAFAEGASRLKLEGLAARDRAFARMIATTALRHVGRLETLVDGYLDKPLGQNAGRTMAIMITGAAQLVLLNTPAHAAISLSVDLAHIDHSSRRYAKLVNAILRRISVDGKAHYASLEAKRDCPPWLWVRWVATYGEDVTRQMFEASLQEPPLDVTVKADAATWAMTLTGIALPTGSVRIREAGRVEELPGFAEGAWWVQDAAAALPARLLHVQPGERVADLCAAPGGKTAQLAAAGASVVAVDASAKRMGRLEENLRRLGFKVETAVIDVESYAASAAYAGTFDAVLLDAPCSATGTIRRHPDLLHIKREADLAGLAERQLRLLGAAARLVKPGGRLVYATCSLEPEEGEGVVDAFLAHDGGFQRDPVSTSQDGIAASFVTAQGDLRTLPHQSLGPDAAMAGLDGFYAARLRRVP
jgi:16S rRNA (cytosine967-C5)-methyltransferase